MLLDIALDLVLHQVGRDRMQHRAEHQVLHTLGPGRIDHGQTHGAFAWMDGRPDVVHLLHAPDGRGQHRRFADVAYHYLLHAQGAQVRGGSLRPDAGPDRLPGRKQLRDE